MRGTFSRTYGVKVPFMRVGAGRGPGGGRAGAGPRGAIKRYGRPGGGGAAGCDQAVRSAGRFFLQSEQRPKNAKCRTSVSKP
jgi:hypothetical protein